jgi:hypothetical protein
MLANDDQALAEKLRGFRAKQAESVAAARLPELS